MAEAEDEVDFALAAFHQDGEWRVAELAHDTLVDVETLVHALSRFPGQGGAVALVAVDEDFFVIARVDGPRTRLLLSDVTAADEWDLAGSVVDFLGLPQPEEDADQQPVGDLALLADLGMSEPDLGDLLDDLDLYSDELLSDVARRLGFGELFDDAIGLTSA